MHAACVETLGLKWSAAPNPSFQIVQCHVIVEVSRRRDMGSARQLVYTMIGEIRGLTHEILCKPTNTFLSL